MSVLDAWASKFHYGVISLYYKSVAMVYRDMTKNAAGLTNPPTYTAASLALASAAIMGATSIALTAKFLVGFVKVGDSFLIAGDATVYTATAPASTNTSSIVTVPIDPPLTAGAAQGTLVAPTWAADYAITAHVMDYPAELIDGTLIKIGDLKVIMPALAFPTGVVPTVNGRLIIDGVARSILDCPALFAGDAPSRYEAHAR